MAHRGEWGVPERTEISVILPVIGEYERVRRTLQALRGQTARNAMEVVLVLTPGKRALVRDEDLAGLRVSMVEIAPVTYLAEAWAEGIRRARSAVVATAEDHSFPEAGWAQALIEAHRGECVAACPALANPNPSLVSWANYLINWTPYFEPRTVQVANVLAGHNTSYKREALLGLEDLPTALSSEAALHLRWAAQGKKLLIVPGAVTRHVNISRFEAYVGHSYHGGRLFGARRSEGWGAVERVKHTVLAPLVPVVRWWRIVGQLGDRKRQIAGWPLPALLLIPGLLAHATGEVVGYVLGQGDALQHYWRFEADRISCVREEEKELWKVGSEKEREAVRTMSEAR